MEMINEKNYARTRCDVIERAKSHALTYGVCQGYKITKETHTLSEVGLF